MNDHRTARLVEIEWPEFGTCPPPAKAPAQEYRERLDSILLEMNERNLSHLIVYGDREHFANLYYLTGFDPRFEEAVLVVGRDTIPVILVGNECESYLNVSPLYKTEALRSERYQTFSLLDQPRECSRPLKEIFMETGMNENSRIGCVGWKYFSPLEFSDPLHAIDIPAYIADLLRNIAGHENVVNATDLFMHPGYGLRTICSLHDIAYFEYTNILASEGMRKMLFGLNEGMLDFDVVRLAGYPGEPLGCHLVFTTEENRDWTLAGPVGAELQKGGVMAANICYRGSNCCRAGWIARSASELPQEAQDYVERFVAPYFTTVNAWLRHLEIGAMGDELWKCVHDRLPNSDFGIYLNPGHLIHYDEWLSSPFYEGSELRLRSGMLIQLDIIPSSEKYFSTRVEDGFLLADGTLRSEIRDMFPGCYSRCQKRREFMINHLGLEVPAEVLPLSNIPGIIPPFFLNPEKVLVMSS